MAERNAKQNALAKLSNWFGRMEERELPAYGYKKDILCINYGKAKHIFAELAKVEEPLDLRTVGMTHFADILEADRNRAVEIVRNCRKIAEEGAGNGK